MLLTEFNEKKYRKLMMQEGREEGQNMLNALYSSLLNANRIDDMRRAMEDKEYRKQLLAEYEGKR